MKQMLKLSFALVIAVLALTTTISAGVPQMINYQGSLADTLGNPVDTTADLTFYIFSDLAGTDLLWSETHTAVAVEVGLFTVMLGEVVAFPGSLFDGNTRFLGIQIGSGPVTAELTPIVSTAYAMHSSHSDTAGYAYAAPGSGSSGWVDDGANVRLAAESDAVVVGKPSADAKFDVFGDAVFGTGSDGGRVTLRNEGHEIRFSRDGWNYISAMDAVGSLLFRTGGANNRMFIASDGNVGIRTTNPQAPFHIKYAPDIQVGPPLYYGGLIVGSLDPGQSAMSLDGNEIQCWGGGSAGNQTLYLQYEGNGVVDLNRSTMKVWRGAVGVGVSSPIADAKLGLATASKYGGYFKTTSSADGTAAVYGEATSTAEDIAVCGGKFVAHSEDGKGVHAYADGDHAEALFAEYDGFEGEAIRAEARGTSGPTAITAVAIGTGPEPYCIAGLFRVEGTGGGYAIKAEGNVLVDGRTTTDILEIKGGSDLAEPFEMVGDGVRPGALVVIDEDNPGKLKLSSIAYDTRVAGIVSGAGGVNPGLTLTQEGVFHGRDNVAISGRVYCLADASQGPIKPGDLLTTSSTPGHAMAATDRGRAYGSVIGKAMTSLDEGQGLVLVLVSLQ